MSWIKPVFGVIRGGVKRAIPIIVGRTPESFQDRLRAFLDNLVEEDAGEPFDRPNSSGFFRWLKRVDGSDREAWKAKLERDKYHLVDAFLAIKMPLQWLADP